MTLSNYIDLLRGKGHSDRTIQIYTGYVRRLMGWSAEHGHDPATIAAHHVRTWADAHLPLSWSSRKAARSALSIYWHARHDQPHEAIRLPAKPKTRYRGMTVEQAVTFTQTARMVGDRAGLAALCLMYTGARAIEVAGFHHDHVDRESGVLSWWRPKQSDWHVMPLWPALAAAIPDGSGHLFQGDGGRAHVTAQTVHAWTRKVADVAELDVNPQKVRATAAHLIAKATRDIEAAAAVLGHRSIETTRKHYTVIVDDERMGRAMSGFDVLD